MNPRPLLLAIAAAVVLAGPLGAQTNPDDILDGVVRSYGDLSASWLERVLPLALKTFALLATLEFAVSGLFWALGRESLDVIAAALLKKFIVLAFLFSLLTLFPIWLPAVTHGFEVAGQTASATSALSPSRVLDLGITISEHMQASLEEVGLLANPAGVLIGCATSILVLIAY
ncbi:MAG TPA: hypothetical protein VHR45_24725, partial [Thermoanaerobaculia bacterium]|nr:hypothetical protein [Thermoanaerobaculia bacterium]